MEWAKKKSFDDFLSEALTTTKPAPSGADYTPAFLFSVDCKRLDLRPHATYKVKTISLEERVEKFLSKLDLKSQNEWKVLSLEARRFEIQALPWDIKGLFRKLALRLHPDHCKDVDASLRFQRIKASYDQLKDAIASVYT